jgi:hypothetical protein
MPSTQDRWNNPIPDTHSPAKTTPDGISNEDFVRWGIHNVWGRSDMVDGYFANRMIRDLNYGLKTNSAGAMYFNEASYLGDLNRLEDFNRQDAYRRLLELADMKNYWERRRVGEVEVTPIPLVLNSKPGELEE